MSPDCCQQDFELEPEPTREFIPPKTRMQRRKEDRASKKAARKAAWAARFSTKDSMSADEALRGTRGA